jgi:hypothetical protein
MRRLTSPGPAQRFFTVHGVMVSHFHPGRHRWQAPAYRQQLAHRFPAGGPWRSAPPTVVTVRTSHPTGAGMVLFTAS